MCTQGQIHWVRVRGEKMCKTLTHLKKYSLKISVFYQTILLNGDGTSLYNVTQKAHNSAFQSYKCPVEGYKQSIE